MAGPSPAMTPELWRSWVPDRPAAVRDDPRGRGAASSPPDPLGLGGVEPPRGGRAEIVFRRRLGIAIEVPVGDPMRGLVPHRHPVAPGAKHTVERARRGHKLWPTFGRKD